MSGRKAAVLHRHLLHLPPLASRYKFRGFIMTYCKFVGQKTVAVKGSEIGRFQMHARTRKVQWCEHTESPLMREEATNTIRKAKILDCGGDLDKCPIDPRKF